ncbi:MAG TPA: type Z 30S ribosomal protein S14 [Patescibacteria group bacterium]|nr:type Z 30S ribosomal protein S14 [Patescibacteria group bacterium]
MAKTSQIVKWKNSDPKSIQFHNRCALCGRPRGYMRKFGICRICFRKLAHEGNLTGVVKASHS